jgi:hypothetical protein
MSTTVLTAIFLRLLANDHPSQESDVPIDAENSKIDEPDIIHDSSKTNGANAEQTESMVYDDVDQNDVSQNIIQGLQKETVSDDVEMEKADETTDASGHVNKDCNDRINEEYTIIDQGKDLSIQGGVEMNDATPMEGSSVIIVEQNIVQDGVTFIQDLLTMVGSNNDEDQASNSEEVEFDNDGIGGSTDYSEDKNDSSDSTIKLSIKHIKKLKKKFAVAVEEDVDDRSKGCESDNSRFSQTSFIEQQDEPELPQFSQSSSLNIEESSSGAVIDHFIKKHKKKIKRRRSDHRQRYGNAGVQSLYHGIFTTFQRHNASP